LLICDFVLQFTATVVTSAYDNRIILCSSTALFNGRVISQFICYAVRTQWTDDRSNTPSIRVQNTEKHGHMHTKTVLAVFVCSQRSVHLLCCDYFRCMWNGYELERLYFPDCKVLKHKPGGSECQNARLWTVSFSMGLKYV
jgi:hypothetical protein